MCKLRNVPPLDLIFNHHFMNKVFFREKFNPLTNDYMIGFWLATFLATMAADEDQITDVLFGTLGGHGGFKTLTILPQGADNMSTNLPPVGGQHLPKQSYFSLHWDC
uniref:Uncharacterized protein n=1 Tax=Romanomermis culicivorax TaxID=13658 RepID=A0A915KGS8_ROMCU